MTPLVLDIDSAGLLKNYRQPFNKHHLIPHIPQSLVFKNRQDVEWL